MTIEQFVSVMVALTALIGAITGMWIAIHGYHREVNHRLDQLLNLTATSSHAEGVIAGTLSAESKESSP